MLGTCLREAEDSVKTLLVRTSPFAWGQSYLLSWSLKATFHCPITNDTELLCGEVLLEITIRQNVKAFLTRIWLGEIMVRIL